MVLRFFRRKPAAKPQPPADKSLPEVSRPQPPPVVAPELTESPKAPKQVKKAPAKKAAAKKASAKKAPAKKAAAKKAK
ncbi:MAG: hypothetical protein QOD77_1838 [Thermoplasmata archaeon]|jgi:hypothetical protein|nr:hypothetical protein [Thermoplasmata archaeon]